MIQQLSAALAIVLGLAALCSSLETYRVWQEYVALGDLSGAEVYEIEFWPKITASVLLLLASGFLAGRASRTR